MNESGQALPWGNLLVNGYQVTTAMQQSVGALLYNANSNQVTPGLPQTQGVISKWVSNANYPFGSLIVDSNNNVQMALYNGATASTSNPPNWPTQARCAHRGQHAALEADRARISEHLLGGDGLRLQFAQRSELVPR